MTNMDVLMRCVIYQKAKTAMQSGRAGKNVWILEMDTPHDCALDNTTGWIASRDTIKQVQLCFPDKESAIFYAKSRQLLYVVKDVMVASPRRRTYTENFTKLL